MDFSRREKLESCPELQIRKLYGMIPAQKSGIHRHMRNVMGTLSHENRSEELVLRIPALEFSAGRSEYIDTALLTAVCHLNLTVNQLVPRTN